MTIAGQTFTVTQAGAVYSISGRVTFSSNGLGGVTVTLSGPQTGTTQTDSNGNYSFANLPGTGNYTVTPSKSNYNFSPSGKTINDLSGNQTANFAATTVIASVSAANYLGPTLAQESIVAAFGTNLATAAAPASTIPLPTTLAGTTVKVRDSNGVERLAPLFYVSPGQVNYQIPPGTASGTATITITSGDGTVSTGTAQIVAVAPGLFAANATGQGVAAAYALRVTANGTQIIEPISQYDAAQSKFVSKPLDLGPESDQVFLVLFGTGIQFRSSPSAVSVKIGGVVAEVLYAGTQGGFVGLDQINVRLPQSLKGRGEVDLVLTVDGQPANTVKVNIK
jgi:uncharacterized protein (TIGR03437 family)